MWELDYKETWVLKNWCFWTVVLEKTLERRVPWTAKRSNQFILKEINPEYAYKGLMLKLRLQYIGHLMQKANSLGKTLMLVKTEDKRRRGSRGWDGWMASPIQWTRTWANSKRQWRAGKPGILQAKGLQRVGHALVTEQQFSEIGHLWKALENISHERYQQFILNVLKKELLLYSPLYSVKSKPAFSKFGQER